MQHLVRHIRWQSQALIHIWGVIYWNNPRTACHTFECVEKDEKMGRKQIKAEAPTNTWLLYCGVNTI